MRLYLISKKYKQRNNTYLHGGLKLPPPVQSYPNCYLILEGDLQLIYVKISKQWRE